MMIHVDPRLRRPRKASAARRNSSGERGKKITRAVVPPGCGAPRWRTGVLTRMGAVEVDRREPIEQRRASLLG